MHCRCDGKPLVKEKIVEVLGENLCNDLKEIEKEIKLYRTLFGFFDRCFRLNKVLVKHNYFLKFFERRDVYRFLIKKKVQGKNEVTRIISSSVLQKFNGYETTRNDLSFNKKAEVIPINIMYEPIYDETIPVPCYFTSKIHLAYKSYFSHFDKGKEIFCHRTVHQCYYCQNFFEKSKENMKKTFLCL